MTDKERIKANAEYYLSRGKCPHCGGKNNVEPGEKLCRECRSEHNARRVNTRTRRREAGLCTLCGGRRDDEKYLTCSACREKIRRSRGKKKAKYQKSWYNRMREEGRCVSCGNWSWPGKARCKDCQKKSSQAARRADPDGSKKRELRQTRIELGLCIDCGKPAEEGRSRCKRCMAKCRESSRIYDITQRIRREQHGKNHDFA